MGQRAVAGEASLRGSRRNLTVYAAEVLLSAAAYTLLFILNEQFNPFFWERLGVSWLFLPAGLRLLLVLLCGWPAAVGIMIGGWITGSWMLAEHAWLVPAFGVINGLAPLLAAWLAHRYLGMRLSLANLTPLSLPGLSLLFAAINVLMQQALYLLSGLTPVGELPTALFAMFFGDVTGALVVLFLTSLFFQVHRHLVRGGH